MKENVGDQEDRSTEWNATEHPSVSCPLHAEVLVKPPTNASGELYGEKDNKTFVAIISV